MNFASVTPTNRAQDADPEETLGDVRVRGFPGGLAVGDGVDPGEAEAHARDAMPTRRTVP